MNWRGALAGLLTATFGLFSIGAHAQFNGCKAGFCSTAPTSAVTPATLTYEAFATEASGNTTITYSSVTFGTANSNRVIAIVTAVRSAAGSTNPITSVTIGGVSATVVTGTPFYGGSGSPYNSEVWYASVPTGTSGNIVVAWTNATTRTGICVYNIVTTTPTPSSGVANGGLSMTNVTQAITVPSNGVALAGYFDQNTGSTLGFTNGTSSTSNTKILELAAWGP